MKSSHLEMFGLNISNSFIVISVDLFHPWNFVTTVQFQSVSFFLSQVFIMVQIGLGWQLIPRQALTLLLAAVSMVEVYPCLTSECLFQWILSMM